MSEDITYCLNKDCKKTKCERHASHIKDKAILHSFAMFDCSDEKTRKWAISRPKNGISLNGREYVCNENGKVKTGEWMPIKCPICGNIDYNYKSYDTEFWGANVTAEQYGDCDKCGYTIRQAHSPVYEGFCDLKRGWKDSNGVYHEKNYKQHRRVRRRHMDRVKQVDQSWVVRYI